MPRQRLSLPWHVASEIKPSPARAEPHDATAWFPVPDPHALPTIEVLLDGSCLLDPPPALVDLTALEAAVSPSPARAEPHDATAWLPLPDDVDGLPSVHALRDPHPDHQAAVVADAEAVVADALAAAEASSAPSPARAEPHDATAWFPLPSPDGLPPVAELLEEGPPRGAQPLRRHRYLPAPRVLGIAVLVVLTALGGSWAAQQMLGSGGSNITFVVDGSREAVWTDADTVGALLAAKGVTLGPGDVVEPPASTDLDDGIHVELLRSFPVNVDIDGTVRVVRTVETSAEQLAEQLKLGKLTAVRDDPGRLATGVSVVFRTRVSGSLKVDNQTVTFDSPSRTVDELLQAYRVKLVGEDSVVPGLDAVLRDGATVAVVRVGADIIPEKRPIEFERVQQPDPSLPIGETRILQQGKNGIMTVTYRQRIENGVKGERQVVSEVPTIEPEPEITGYGTYANPKWDQLAACESGGRWGTIDANPNGYDGGLGIHTKTWLGWGGAEFAPRAGYATREEQITVAMRIYADLGWDPWGCATGALNWPRWGM